MVKPCNPRSGESLFYKTPVLVPSCSPGDSGTYYLLLLRTVQLLLTLLSISLQEAPPVVCLLILSKTNKFWKQSLFATVSSTLKSVCSLKLQNGAFITTPPSHTLRSLGRWLWVSGTSESSDLVSRLGTGVSSSIFLLQRHVDLVYDTNSSCLNGVSPPPDTNHCDGFTRQSFHF